METPVEPGFMIEHERASEWMPTDPDAELTLIGNLLDPGVEPRSRKLVCSKVTEGMFLVPFHQELYRIIKTSTLHDDRPCFDVDYIVSRATPKMMALRGGRDGFRSSLTELMAKTDLVARVEAIADIVIEVAKKREAYKLGLTAMQRIAQGSTSDDVLYMMQEVGTRIQASGGDMEVHAMSAAAMRLNSGIPLLEPRRSNKLIYTGLPSIDNVLLNLPGTLGVVAATPGGGKSTLMVQSAYETAKRGGRPMLVSLEMDGPEIESRLAARATGIDHRQLLLHGLPRGTFISDETVGILDNVFYDCDLSGITWPALESRISQAVVKFGVTNVWVDYLTLMNPPDTRGRNMASSYGEITKACKRTAQKLGIAIVMVSQFNRLAASEPEPQLHHLRETGQLEQDATWVACMWERGTERWIKIAKNRSGAKTVRRRISFDGAAQHIVEYTGDEAA